MADSSGSNGFQPTAPEKVHKAGGRALRPFRLRQMMGAVALVNVRAQTMNELVVDLAADSPWEVIDFQQRLGNFMTCMEALEESARDLRTVCANLFESAPEDHAVAQRAALAVLRNAS